MRKIVAFFIKEQMDFREYLQEDKWEEFQKTFRNLYDEGRIIADYSSPFPFKLMPEQIAVESLDVDKYRKYWKHSVTGVRGYMGERKEITKLLQDYWLKYPTHTFEQICKAAKEYTEAQCAKDVKYLMTAENFIYRDGKSRLATWVEDGSEKLKSVWI